MIPGFWRTLWTQKRDVFLQWDFALAVITAIASFIVPGRTELESRFELILTTEAAIIIGLLGIVLAALAIVIAFLSDDLIELLDSHGGLQQDVWPFSFTSLLAVCSAVFPMAALATVPKQNEQLTRFALAISSALFVWTLLSVLALVRVVYKYGQVRASHIRVRRSQSDSSPPTI
jgi:hypothetical protein